MKVLFMLSLVPALLAAWTEEQKVEMCGRVKDAKNISVLFTHRRTGTNWTYSSLMYLTNRKFVDLRAFPNLWNFRGWNALGVKIDNRKPFLYRTHDPFLIRALDPQTNKIIMSIRDYRELFFRGDDCENASNRGLHRKINKFVASLLDYLITFDNWPEQRRCFFRYEDLITEPRRVFSDLLSFLGESDGHLNDYIANYDALKQKMIEAYEYLYFRAGGSITKGESTRYHVKNVDRDLIRQLDDALKEQASKDIWDKYLSHYYNLSID